MYFNAVWYRFFCNYCSAIIDANEKENYNKDLKEDLKTLKRIVDSETEPSIVRARAADACARLYGAMFDLQLDAGFYRHVIAICDSAPEYEMNRQVQHPNDELADSRPFVPARETMFKMKEYAKEKLTRFDRCQASGITIIKF